MAARVYADVKGGRCPCGGTFSKRVPYDNKSNSNLIMPICEACGQDPELYAIDVDAKDENGNPLKFRIRNTKDSERLGSRESIAYIVKVIQRELLEGTFNIRHYDSSKSKEAFILKNYVESYLEKYTGDKKFLAWKESGSVGKIQGKPPIKKVAPKTLKDKIGLINREILPFLGNMEIFRVRGGVINKFKDSIIGKDRTQSLALGELKAILNEAHRDEMIPSPVKFDPIPRANKRDSVIPFELAKKTIEAMPKQIYKDFYSLLLIYPIRPGELRALKWSEVNLSKGEFIVCYHFSNEERIPGRKSIGKEKKEGSITFPINPQAREIFSRLRNVIAIDRDQYVFLSRFGRFLSEATVWEAWNLARKRVGHSFAPYECRHASASELYKKVNGDLIRMKEVGGWTNTSTLERYVTDRSDNTGLF